MKPWVRWVVIGLTAVAVVVLFVVLQPGGTDGAPSPTVSPPPTDSVEPSPTVSPSPAPTEPPEPQARVIQVTVRGGEVDGPPRPEVALGETIVLIVRADVTDHIHVHGYDLMADVSPGDPARIRFEADVPGVFEVELEDAGRLLLELEIAP